MSSKRLVAAAVVDGVGTVRLADAAHRNVLSATMSDDLADAVGEVLAESVGAIVLSADPPVFCAGGSLDSLLSRDVPLSQLYRGFLALANARVPTIAAVGGPAVGAGVTLPLACDVVIASAGARFDPRFLDVGIHPGGGHLWRLQRRIGSQGAAALVLFGDVLTGEEAVTAGLAWRCVEEDALEPTVMALARRAAQRPRALVARTKQTLRASEAILDPAEAAALELEAQQWSIEQPGFDDRIRTIQEAIGARSRASKP